MIVWLASYPRSGNTLLRMILRTYFNQSSYSKYNDKLDIGANESLAELVGHIEYEENWEGFYERASTSKELQFIKTHDKPESDDKAIYIVRDGRASAASYLKYLSNYSKLEHDLSDIVSGAASFGSWAAHLDNWDPLSRPNTLLLKYEDLIQTPELEVRKISEFLGLKIKSGDLPKFSELKIQHPRFFPIGGNQKHMETIPDEDLHHLVQNFGPWLKKLGYLEDISFDEHISRKIASQHNQKVLSYKREILERQNATGATSVEASLRDFSEKIKFVEHATLAASKNVVAAEARIMEGQSDLITKLDQTNAKEEILDKVTELSQGLSGNIESLESQSQKTFDQNTARFEILEKNNIQRQVSIKSEVTKKIGQLNTGLLKNMETLLRDLGASQDDGVSTKFLQLSEQIQTVSQGLQGLQSSQKDREALTEISHTYISELQDKNRQLQSAVKEAYDSLSKEKVKSRELRVRIRKFADIHDSMLEKLYEYDYVLQPRFKTLLELRPIKHILDGRKKMKANGGILPLDSFQLSSEILPVSESALVSEISDQPLSKKQYNLPVIPAFNPLKTKEPLGIAVYTFDRKDMVHNVLESLAQQNVLDLVNVWIDGDQGNPTRRKKVDETEALVRQYPVKKVRRNRGNYGFRKMMLTSQRYMLERYEKIIFLEDDCFPCDLSVESFSEELDRIKDDPSIFSVYGHPFLVPGEGKDFGRFQGWGWATTSEKLEPILKELLSLYLLTEEEYLEWVKQNLTPDIIKKIDVTPGRSPIHTITKFFAWDEMTCMLTAMKNQTHKRSDRRLIYNCGVGASSAHFSKIDHFTKPPFNMVSPENIWDYF